MATRTAVVTGASGYLGLPLVQRLCEQGWQVRAVSRAEPSAPGAAQWLRPEPVLTADAAIIEQAWQPTAQAMHSVDTVFHLAGIAHQGGQSQPDVYHRANALGSEAVARRAAEQGVRHMVLISSVSAVAASSGSGALTPDAEPRPVSSYGISKLRAEKLVAAALQGSNTTLTIVRPPLVYGPYPKANLLSLVRLLHTGLPLPLGAVDNRRSMIALPNLLDLLIRLPRNHRGAGHVLMPADVTLSTPALVTRLRAAMSMSPRLFRVAPAVLGVAGRAPMAGRLLRPLIDSLEVRDNALADNPAWQPAVAPHEVMTRMVHSVIHGAGQ